ncbi:MAG: hypothetical protein IT535_13665 [Bauldia sp.]|nr:hypothetical protein [Bauldia sp.]
MQPDGLEWPGSTSRQKLLPGELSNLIGAIYDCALDPALWPQTLLAMADALRCKSGSLHLVDLPGNRLLVHHIVGLEPEWAQLPTKHLGEINEVLGRTLATMSSIDRPFIVSRDVPPADVEASPYMRESARGGIVDILQYFLVHTPRRFSGVAFGRSVDRGPITDREVELGGLLLPHVRRAVTISNVLDARTIERTQMAQALDTLRCGVVLTNDRGLVLHANRAAESMLEAGYPIRSSHGVLGTEDPAAARELQSAIRLAAVAEGSIGKVGLGIRLSDDVSEATFAHILPLTGSERRSQLQPEAVAAVFVSAPGEPEEDARAVAEAYRLTGAEARVLAGLLGGDSLGDTADALGIAITTARTHLDRIFSKTGTSRQAELMLLASRALVPVRAPSDG